MTVSNSNHGHVAARRRHILTRAIKLALLFFPLVFIALLILLKINRPWFYSDNVLATDGPVVWVTGLAYLLAGIMAAVLSIRLCENKRRLYFGSCVLFALSLLYIGGEQISWGRWVAAEQAIDFHNSRHVQCEFGQGIFSCRLPVEFLYILVGFYGVFARLCWSSSTRTRPDSAADLLTPRYFLISYFLPLLVLYLYFSYLYVPLVYLLGPEVDFSNTADTYPDFIRQDDRQPIHLLLSVGLLLFVIDNLIRHSSRRALNSLGSAGKARSRAPS